MNWRHKSETALLKSMAKASIDFEFCILDSDRRVRGVNKPVETETASRPALGGRFCIPYSVFHILDFADQLKPHPDRPLGDGSVFRIPYSIFWISRQRLTDCARCWRVAAWLRARLLRLFRSASPAAAPADIPAAAARVAIEHPLTRISSFPSEASVSCNFEMATHECRLTDHD